MIVNIIAGLVLIFSFIGGIAQGAVKSLFSLVASLLALWLTGLCYHIPAGWLSFIRGENWENFLGFIITLAVISIVLHLILFLPRFILNKLWFIKGLLFRLLGGIFNLFNCAIGLTVFTLLVAAYPIMGWLEDAVLGSSILTGLVHYLGFIQALIPGLGQGGEGTSVLLPLLQWLQSWT